MNCFFISSELAGEDYTCLEDKEQLKNTEIEFTIMATG